MFAVTSDLGLENLGATAANCRFVHDSVIAPVSLHHRFQYEGVFKVTGSL